MLQALNLPKKVYFKTGCTPVALRELSEVYHCQRVLLERKRTSSACAR